MLIEGLSVQLPKSSPTLGLYEPVGRTFGHPALERLAQCPDGHSSALSQKLQYGRSEDVVPHRFCCLFEIGPMRVTLGPGIGVGHRMRPSVDGSSGATGSGGCVNTHRCRLFINLMPIWRDAHGSAGNETAKFGMADG